MELKSLEKRLGDRAEIGGGGLRRAHPHGDPRGRNWRSPIARIGHAGRQAMFAGGGARREVAAETLSR